MYRVSKQNYISEVQLGVFVFSFYNENLVVYILKIRYVVVNRRRPLSCPEVNSNFFDY